MTEGTVDTPQVSRRKIIERPRLTRLLDDSPARIKMLIAPAGYGKTTLARQWLSKGDRIGSWFTAGAAAIDLAAFAREVAAAVSVVVPGASDRLLQRLHVSSSSADRDALIFAEMLAAELADWPANAVLAIDDYHRAGRSRACEDFFDHLMELAPVTVLVLARQRPGWAAAKRIVYGDLLEIGPTELAMTVEEASQLLDAHEAAAQSGLIALAEGWPAVLGLARSTTAADLPNDGIPTTLYNYLAEEIFQAVAPAVRRVLCVLSVLHESSWHVASAVLGADALHDARSRGEEVGAITFDLSGTSDIHPLLRRYLRDKLRDYNDDLTARQLEQVWSGLLAESRWDEAFEFAIWTNRSIEIPRLLEAGLEDMLDAGRTLSVARWLEQADKAGLANPIAQIAAAELSARKGLYRRAEMLAVRAAEDKNIERNLAARALCVAGHAAHLVSRDVEALGYYRRALEDSGDRRTRDRAEWGVFTSQVDLGLEADAALSLRAIEQQSREQPELILRAANARLLRGMRFGPLSEVGDVSAALQIVHDVGDPMRRCGFWVTYGAVLAMQGLYSEAAAAVDELERDAERHRLDFTRPYSGAISAILKLGQRAFEGAARAAEESLAGARAVGDQHGVANAIAISGRIELSQQRYGAAEAMFEPVLTWDLTFSMISEIKACHALALACQGKVDVDSFAQAGEVVNCGPEAQVLSACARAIDASVRGTRHVVDLSRRAVSLAVQTGNLDSLVVAYRAHPEFLLCSNLRDTKVSGILNALMMRAGDAALAESLGLALPQHPILSRRETEIHALIAAGLTNREIAERLVISEATVKLHVHHVLEKLGVRTRTAAALRKLAQG